MWVESIIRRGHTPRRSTPRRYHERYKSAKEVRNTFRDDVRRQIKQLGLPTLDDVKPEFESLADKLGVGHSRSSLKRGCWARAQVSVHRVRQS